MEPGIYLVSHKGKNVLVEVFKVWPNHGAPPLYVWCWKGENRAQNMDCMPEITGPTFTN